MGGGGNEGQKNKRVKEERQEREGKVPTLLAESHASAVAVFLYSY